MALLFVEYGVFIGNGWSVPHLKQVLEELRTGSCPPAFRVHLPLEVSQLATTLPSLSWECVQMYIQACQLITPLSLCVCVCMCVCVQADFVDWLMSHRPGNRPSAQEVIDSKRWLTLKENIRKSEMNLVPKL